jgi:hypothetical protein
MIISNVELFFCKLDPERPSARFNKVNPTWEVQIRTKDKDIRNDWIAAGMNVTSVVPDVGDLYFRVNLRKKSIREDGTPADPVEVVDGKLNPIDPNTIGNGSIGNVKIHQYTYTKEGGGKGTASILNKVQVTKHLVYVPRAYDEDFTDVGETEVFMPEDQ